MTITPRAKARIYTNTASSCSGYSNKELAEVRHKQAKRRCANEKCGAWLSVHRNEKETYCLPCYEAGYDKMHNGYTVAICEKCGQEYHGPKQRSRCMACLIPTATV